MSLYGRKSAEEDESTDAGWCPESGVQGVAQNWLDDHIFDEEPLFELTPWPSDLD
jgi:hypothetical protein